MPTENRSSNTEMVSVQATIESLEEAYAGDSALEFMNDAAQLLRQFKSLSTLEHQGEPVAYIEAADLRDIACGSPWGGTVWGRQSREPYPPRVPVYTHADPGEAERLTRKAANADLALAAQTRQVHSLRAQLAERDALLREVLVGLWPSTPLAIKINAALSASAEPSAPVEIDERPEGCCCPPKGYNGLWAAGPCPVHQGLRKLEQARTALARKPS